MSNIGKYWIDDSPNPDDKELVDSIVAELKKDLIPFCKKHFTDFEIYFVKGIKHLGKYLDGIHGPIVIISMSMIKKSCDEYDVDLYTGVKSTIVHELGHALQQAKGKPLNEQKAENFAYSYTMYGKVVSV